MVNDSKQASKNADKYINIFVATIFVLLILGVCILFNLMSSQIKSSEKITHEVSEQLAFNVYNRIIGDLQVLDMISSSIGDNIANFKPNNLKAYLKTDGREATFNSFAFVDKNGYGHISTRGYGLTQRANMNKLPCISKSLHGQMCFDRVQISNVDDDYLNIYSVPIKFKGKNVAALSAQARADIFKNILDINTFNGTAFSHIVKANGNYVVRSDNKNVEAFQNYFDQPETFIGVNEDKLRNNFKSLSTGVYWTYFAGQLWICSYVPVNYSDWLIVLYVPASILALNSVIVVLFTIGIMLAINCLVFLILKRIESMQRKNYEKMMEIAFVDEVTGGHNKAKFILEAQNILKNVSSTDKYALILMDIAKFKVINEIYGFEMANVVLKDVYNVIKADLPENAIMARSFAATYLFIIKYDSEQDINKLVDKIHKDINEYNEETMNVIKTGSNKAAAKLVPLFGVYLINDVTVPIYIMCDRVGLAKRTIADDINKYVSYYDDNLRKQLLNEKNIEDEMHKALATGQFVMYLQPKYDMKTLRVVGSEALVRWIHPVRGFMPPNDFIPLFEKNGFVMNVDRYMWEQACIAIKSWIDRKFNPVPISVNVSRLHLTNEYFIDDLKALILKYQIPPELLELELTESAGFEDFDKFLDIVNELKKYGFSIAMDDFGSGYSSLNMLRQIPCDILKLDRGFINDSTTDERGKIVVQHVLSMAKNLSLKTVSEGIETVEQAQFLTDSGCDIAQGFLYAKPMKLEDFEKIAFPNQPPIQIEGLKVN